MRIEGRLLFALLMVGCAQTGAQLAKQADSDAQACVNAVKASPDGRIVYTRLWASDDTDTAEKLSDPKPLTKEERAALVRVHNGIQPCRKIIIGHNNAHAAWATPHTQELFQRGDAIFAKLASGELPVGVANKLTIEIVGRYQVDVSRGHADVVQAHEIQRQRNAEAMARGVSDAMKEWRAQQQVTTTDCTWLGNTLNCTSRRR